MMTPERWQQIDQLYQAALDQVAADRSKFLSSACADDSDLRREVESLLLAHEQAGSFIAEPALRSAAKLLASDQAKLLIGSTLAHYRIESILGAGGMGEVYLALDVKLNRRVALKLLPASFNNYADQLGRFEQEARAASALNHPNIITIYEIGKTNSNEGGNASLHFIAMEFVDGETLRARVQRITASRSGMTLTEIIQMAEQIAEALTAAHAEGIIHRDLKPENVLIRRDGYVKVLDFGLAKLTTETEGGSEDPTLALVKTSSGVVMGTVSYMSPEQARGLTVDARTDIWSLGVVLFEMITGESPFQRSTTSDTLVAVLEREPALLSSRVAQVPSELQRIVSKALQKDREDRYQTIKDLRIDLKNLARQIEVADGKQAAPITSDTSMAPLVSAGIAPSATSTAEARATQLTSSAEYLVNQIKQHKGAARSLIAVLILLAAGLFYLLYKIGSQNRQALTSGPLKMRRLTSTGKALNPAISPDGKYVAYALYEAGQQSLWLSQVAVSGQNQIVPSDAVIYLGITFSRDGNFVYYVKEKLSEPGVGVLYQVPTLGGTEERKLIAKVNSPVSFSPDGKRLAFLRAYPSNANGDALIVANADGTDESVLLTRKQPDTLSRGGPSWSADGETIACGNNNVSGGYSNVVSVRVKDGTEIPITSKQWPGGQVEQVSWLAQGDDLLVTAADQRAGLHQIWHLSAARNEARQITTDVNGYSSISLTADSNTLATMRIDRAYNLWVATIGNTASIRQITSGVGRQDGVAGLNWTPDDKIVFRSNAIGEPNIWMIGADGSGTKQITTSRGGYPAVTPDGRYLIWITDRSGTSQVWRMDIDGGNPKQLTNAEGVSVPVPSRDGNWVIYAGTDVETKSTRLWRVSIDGGEPARLTEKPSAAPVVSPDGKLIACNWLDEKSGQWNIGILPFEGGEPSQILDIPGIQTRHLRWTSDGKAISFVRIQNGVANIWAQPIDGSTPKQLTDFKDQRIVNFAWSRDGKQLALSRGLVNSDVVLITGFK